MSDPLFKFIIFPLPSCIVHASTVPTSHHPYASLYVEIALIYVRVMWTGIGVEVEGWVVVMVVVNIYVYAE